MLYFLNVGLRRSILGSRTAEVLLLSIRNSFITASCTSLANLILGTSAAYSLARLQFPFRSALIFNLSSLAAYPRYRTHNSHVLGNQKIGTF